MRSLLAFLMFFLLLGTGYSQVLAQTTQPLVPVDSTNVLIGDDQIPVGSAAATLSATLQPSETKESDITQPSGEAQQTLTTYLKNHHPAELSWHNPLQHLIYQAVEKGLNANIVVLLLLFPLIASVIAFSRHVIGLEGYGVYTPAVMSVAFVSTGFTTGITMFLAIFAAAIISRWLVSSLKLQYLPRTALMLWGVAVAVLMFLIISSILGVQALLSLNIFPLLIMMLLSENFMETQLMSTRSKAFRLTLETLGLAGFCSLIISFEPLQRVVILNPELTLLVVALFTVAIGRYTGLRFMERFRFHSIIES